MDRKSFERLTAGIAPDGDGCWEWCGPKNQFGYGRVYVDGKRTVAHRVVYEIFEDNIPEGMDLDHLCRNRGCVNPSHLEPVTRKENVNRGLWPAMAGFNMRDRTHCEQGHEFTAENTYRYHGHRGCKECRRERTRQWRARQS